jgi:opacity protein-like surface antigen
VFFIKDAKVCIMKKNITALLVCLVWPMTTLAESTLSNNKNEIPVSCPTPITLKDRYYIGVAAGYDVYKMQDNISYQNVDNFNVVNTNPELALNGMIGDVIFGYGKLIGRNSNLYMGAELFANGSAADSDFQTSIVYMPVIIDTDMVVNGSYGLALLSGFRLNNASMIYLKLGYNWSTVSLDETIRSGTEFEPTSIEYHDEVTIKGLLYGIGIESAFNEQFSLRSEYTHAVYSSFTANSGVRIASSRNQILFGLIYRFNS